MSKMRRTWSSMSRCCAVTHTRLSMRSACFASSRMTGPSLTASGRVPKTVRTFNIAPHSNFGSNLSGSGALRPPPPVVAPLVPRCALLPAATPRDVLAALGNGVHADGLSAETYGFVASRTLGIGQLQSGRSPIMRGVGAGRSAQRGTSGATTGPRGARSAPPNPDKVLARSVPPNPDKALARSAPPNPEFVYAARPKDCAAVSAIWRPMARELVAPGEGALRTWTMRLVWVLKT